MSRNAALAVLALAALLEAGGDALVRTGLRSNSTGARLIWFLAGAAVLFLYGWTVNSPPWDFGRLLGLYVVFFFLFAQVISWLVFHQRPAWGVMIGGVFIMIGGIIIWRT
jgi:drug/metabolite transporter superfamily protein YnfA